MSQSVRRPRRPVFRTAQVIGSSVTTSLAIVLTYPPDLAAQEAAAAAGATETEARARAGSATDIELQPVVVRARLADEAIRDVPFSIDVLSAETLEARQSYSVQDALTQVPGVELNDGGGDTWNASVRIRGMGALQKVSGEDTSVGLSVDGVPMLFSNISSLAFDLERIEVLKGPQGTLYGNNSEAGAINVITARPTRHVESWFRTEIGTGKHRMAEGAISGPLSPTLSGRLAVRGLASDNQVTDYQTGKPLSRPRDTGVRASLLWEPFASTRVMLTAQHDSLRNHPNVYLLRPYSDPPAMDRGTLKWRDDSRRIDRVAATVERDFAAVRFTSVSGYVAGDTWMSNVPYEGLAFRRLLGMPIEDGGYFIMANQDKSLSQELRLSSLPGDPWFWVVGTSWISHDRHVDMPFGAFDHFYPSSTVNGTALREIRSISRALFGEITVPVAERLKLTTGLRYTRDSKTYDASWMAAPGNPNPIRYAEDSDALRDSFVTGRLAANWAATRETNLYAGAARGYKSGGYNDSGSNITMGLADAPYAAARVNSLEVGFKQASSDGRRGLNGAVFHARSKGDHLLQFDTVTFAMKAENLDTRSRGLELGGFWKPGAGLTLRGGLAYVDARITGVPATSTSGAAVGNRVPDSPRWSANLGLEHQTPIASFLGWSKPTLSTQLSTRFVSDRAADPQNNFSLPGYHQIDLRVGVRGASTEVYLWVKNLTDKRYDQMGYYYPAMVEGGADAMLGSPSRGRIVGIGLSHYF